MAHSGRLISTKTMVIIGMFAAALAVISQIAIPSPFGVPLTLQTFAVALIGIILGPRLGSICIGVYIFIGAVGMPVFANMKGGIGALLDKTGGFLWGFIFLAMLCGLGVLMKHKIVGIATGLAGLVICHLLGVFQFSVLMHMGFWQTTVLVSLPYILKDIISVVLAFILGAQIKSRLLKSGAI